MSNPTTVSSNITERAIISVPTEPWEQTPYGRAVTGNVRLSSNEGPEQLTSPITGQQFIVYSAARSDNPNYCLGLLALKQYDGTDPMNALDWEKSDGCVFYQNKLEGAYSVGHASFVKSPDGSEWFREYFLESAVMSFPADYIPQSSTTASLTLRSVGVHVTSGRRSSPGTRRRDIRSFPVQG